VPSRPSRGALWPLQAPSAPGGGAPAQKFALLMRSERRRRTGDAARHRPHVVAGGDLALGDADFDTPAGEHRVNGVVVAVHSDQRLLGNPRHSTAIRLERYRPERPLLTLHGQPLGRDIADRAMRSTVHLLSPTVESPSGSRRTDVARSSSQGTDAGARAAPFA
jgi:hypothetical protein